MVKKLIALGIVVLVVGAVLFVISGAVDEVGKPLYPYLYGPQQLLFICLIFLGLVMVGIGCVKKKKKVMRE